MSNQHEYGLTEVAMDGFVRYKFSYHGLTREVYKLGEDSSPAVLILLELPGMTRHTVDLARRLHRDGYVVYLPLIFGGPNSRYEPFKNIGRLCVQREFNLLAHHKPSLISEWLRALCREMQAASGGPVGAIGMCFTGSFVLSLMVDEAVAAPVMSQPGFARGFLSKEGRAGLGVPEQDIEKAVQRCQQEDIDILGLRFKNDVMCTQARFDTMQTLFGEHFIRVEIDNSLFNRFKIPPYAHAVLTIDYCDAPGHPTRKAYDTLIEFLGKRLRKAGNAESAEHLLVSPTEARKPAKR